MVLAAIVLESSQSFFSMVFTINKDRIINRITLYAYTFRSRAERVLWVLQELGLEFDVVRINPFEGRQVSPTLLELNPDGKVPVLLHGGKVLLESLAIMEYLDSISEEGGLVPMIRKQITNFVGSFTTD